MSRILCVVLLPTLTTIPAVARAATIDVELTGVANDRGLIRVAVCTAATFTTKHCPFSGALPAQPGQVVVRLEDAAVSITEPLTTLQIRTSVFNPT